jgi:molybdopterin adenylyltransferase
MAMDLNRNFIPVRVAVLTVSDTRDFGNDLSGDKLVELIEAAGHRVMVRALVRDEVPSIEEYLRRWVEDADVDVIISTGGTGITGRDVTPEAFYRVVERDIPGFGELFRMLSYAKIGPSTMQSRAVGGTCKGKYLFALPGSVGAVRDAWEDILVHQLDYRSLPCNLVELMPRLLER